MSDARETANCRVTCITHISEKDFQMLLTLKKGYTYIYIAPTACTRSHIATTMQKMIITKIRKNCPLKSSYVAPRVIGLFDCCKLCFQCLYSILPGLSNQRTSGPVNAHLVSRPRISTHHTHPQ